MHLARGGIHRCGSRSGCTGVAHTGRLQSLETRNDRAEVVSLGGRGQLHECDLEQESCIWCMAHLDQHLTEHLDRANRARCAESASLIGDELALSVRELDELWSDGGEEALA
ncbi:MAG: hypothetical protein EBY96_07305 [Actinobacteria bacterium]|nr:hypothetical protein [Actinomycetota bacterium]